MTTPVNVVSCHVGVVNTPAHGGSRYSQAATPPWREQVPDRVWLKL
jgi:hypothetical protein